MTKSHKGYEIRNVYERTGGLMRRFGRYPVGIVYTGVEIGNEQHSQFFSDSRISFDLNPGES
jgi:hypothetical protein